MKNNEQNTNNQSSKFWLFAVISLIIGLILGCAIGYTLAFAKMGGYMYKEMKMQNPMRMKMMDHNQMMERNGATIGKPQPVTTNGGEIMEGDMQVTPSDNMAPTYNSAPKN